MAHFLDIDDLAEEATAQGLADIVAMLEEAAQKAAEAIVKKRGDVAIIDDAAMHSGFGGLCVGFGPVSAGQACPDDFIHYDDGSTWAEGDTET